MADYYVATTGNDSTGDGSSGVPWASLGHAVTAAIAGDAGWNIYIKAGTYTTTSSTPNADAGIISMSQNGASDAAPNRIQAYTTTPGDGGIAKLDASGISSCTMFSVTGHRTIVEGIECDGNGLSAVKGFTTGSGITAKFLNCIARECTYGFQPGSSGTFHRCQAIGCTDRGFAVAAGSKIIGCAAITTAGYGFVLAANAFVTGCVAYGGTGANGYGFYIDNVDGATCIGCTAYGNAKSGFIFGSTNSYDSRFVNCLSYGNTTYGFEAGNAKLAGHLVNCAAGGNSSGNTSNLNDSVVDLSSGDPFKAAGSADFRLDLTASQGMACRAAGIGPVGQTSYPDIGAVQHGDTTVPAVGDVESGVTFGDGAALTGTFVVPAEEDVEDGVTYGAGGTEFEGTLAGGGGGGAIILSGMGQIGVSQS